MITSAFLVPSSVELTCLFPCFPFPLSDYDDTILPSSFLSTNNLRLDEPAVVPASVQKLLLTLEQSALKLLMRAKESGQVIIITNAETGWVELSAKKFLPGLVPLLSELDVFSARSTYESMHPDSPANWKVEAFHHKITEAISHLDTHDYKNIISIGDSIHERHALHRFTSTLSNVSSKSLKFVERPSTEQLKRQLDLVESCFEEIVSHRGPLDLMLTISLILDSASA